MAGTVFLSTADSVFKTHLLYKSVNTILISVLEMKVPFGKALVNLSTLFIALKKLKEKNTKALFKFFILLFGHFVSKDCLMYNIAWLVPWTEHAVVSCPA